MRKSGEDWNRRVKIASSVNIDPDDFEKFEKDEDSNSSSSNESIGEGS